MKIRSINSSDISKIRQLIHICKPLDLHTSFTYWILSEYFSNTCLVLEDGENIVGYAGGMKSSSMEGVFYLWQIGLMPDYRGKGYFSMLLDEIIKEAKSLDCTCLEFSVLSDNYQSINAFMNYAKNKELLIEKRGSLNFYDGLTNEKCNEDIYRIYL